MIITEWMVAIKARRSNQGGMGTLRQKETHVMEMEKCLSLIIHEGCTSTCHGAPITFVHTVSPRIPFIYSPSDIPLFQCDIDVSFMNYAIVSPKAD